MHHLHVLFANCSLRDFMLHFYERINVVDDDDDDDELIPLVCKKIAKSCGQTL